MPNEKIMDFLKLNSVNVFLNVSTTEGLPVSIMEALSFGIPVIATDVGGVGELVNERTGKLLNVNIDAAELSIKISEILMLPAEKKSELRLNARKMFLEKVSADINYRNFYEVLSRL